jgi:transposase
VVLSTTNNHAGRVRRCKLLLSESIWQKNVFRVHGCDAGGNVAVSRPLTRRQLQTFVASCRRAWSGWRRALRSTIGRGRYKKHGHAVRLMAPQYVPYVKSNKNDACDAEAICKAVPRPTMRFVAVRGRPCVSSR